MQVQNWKSSSILVVAALVSVAVIVGLFVAIPKSYVSKALLKVEERGSPKDSLDAFNKTLARVESIAKLTELIKADNLYLSESYRMTLEEVIQQMRKHIHMTSAPNIGALALAFEYSDPQMAQKVTQDLATRFLEENVSNSSTTLSILDPPSLPQSPMRPNKPMIIAFGVACFFLMWGALSLIRSVSRRHAPAV